MTGLVNNTGSSIWSGKIDVSEKHAQEKLSTFVAWPIVLLSTVITLDRNAANCFSPYQSMAWTVALPPSQLQLRRIRGSRLVCYQWGYTHLMSASPAWEILCKSVPLEHVAWSTQTRVELARLRSCFKPDLQGRTKARKGLLRQQLFVPTSNWSIAGKNCRDRV